MLKQIKGVLEKKIYYDYDVYDDYYYDNYDNYYDDIDNNKNEKYII